MLITYLLKVSLLLAILTLGYRWLIQFETFSKVNRALLWLNVLAAWSLPFIPLPDWGPVTVQQEFHHRIPEIIKEAPVIQEKIVPANSSVSRVIDPQTTNWNGMDWIMALYFLGVIMLTARLLYQVGKLLFNLWKMPSERLENGIVLIRNADTTAPYSFFRWIICNPDKHSSSEIDHILAHETEHVYQWHSLDLLLAETQRILLWFNPVAWFHQQLVQENLEYLADRAVLENGFHKKQYQFSLLKAVMQHHELPLTNSFAQSLLKKRIKMMNRKPSTVWVWGKYWVLVALIYLSSAFVAPYRQQVISLAPSATKPIIEALLADDALPASSVSEIKGEESLIKLNEISKIEVPVIAEENQKDSIGVSTSKCVLIKNDTLYWAISPLATWDDINRMKEDVKNFGGEININAIAYDPLQLFITSIAVHVKTKGSSGQGNSSEGEKQGTFKPINGYSGYITKVGLGMGQLPPAPLHTSFEKDYQQALVYQKQNEVNFFEYNFTKKLGGTSSTGLSRELLEGANAERISKGTGLGKSENNTLKLSESLKNAEFYLNTKPATFEEINTLPFEMFEKARIIEDGNKKKYIIIHAK
ncbi:M56 family metallopeptidase [Dyadobacter sp. LHD-138]|uniref:M56 family metallopeptidase n=1 Tax=Dyadobacter sp. LHD-138 TaxID=3071413 RepID=UPI0027DF7388|nr:M56 family metallopeptidase [Dyadobacter sp. LHD-138]MDQ6481625.1 M56 family metallopeptidase [Dyadobacter sp. LHD-138]